mmetsp:Transcript_52889/g.133009  ORF Transcript_52889/g.133009 Transcript_52889/m.133009 type:complete len:327 (-) Transcript_52889:361-1341(-)
MLVDEHHDEEHDRADCAQARDRQEGLVHARVVLVDEHEADDRLAVAGHILEAREEDVAHRRRQHRVAGGGGTGAGLLAHQRPLEVARGGLDLLAVAVAAVRHVQYDVGEAGDGPRVDVRIVDDHGRVALRVLGVGDGRLDVLGLGAHQRTGAVEQRHVGDAGVLHEGEHQVADRVGHREQAGQHTKVALQLRRLRSVGLHQRLGPRGEDAVGPQRRVALRERVERLDEDLGGATRVGAGHHADLRRRERKARVESHDGRIVPAGDLVRKDGEQGVAVQAQVGRVDLLAGDRVVQLHHGHHTAAQHREHDQRAADGGCVLVVRVLEQ